MDISIQTLIFVMANFLILVAILYKFMWGPVIRLIDSRQQTMYDSLNNADEARREAEQMSAKLAEEIADARRQAKAILDEAQKNAEVTKEDILAQARNSADSILARTEAEIAKEKADAILAIKGEVADMVVSVAGRLLAEDMSDKQHMALVDKYIAEVAAKND